MIDISVQIISGLGYRVKVCGVGINLFKIFHKQLQGLEGGIAEVFLTAFVFLYQQGADVVLRTVCNPNGSDLEAWISTRAGKACGGNGIVGLHEVYDAFYHLTCHFFGNGILLLDELGINAQNLCLGKVGITDSAALIVCGRTRSGGDYLGNLS